ncbi:MAG TPA: tRNA (adenosine(37)-N6)-threonylcarbamoyltransferase complex ATPase subunit type 1 TsaE [Syntrophorhabdaceae bacterium]|nr:tRNA (adenosine(37)-N6)-threonylcarbamoyltransferase complex ATPase subunit type 1 TsaE [Syntrophorhabdaceae bacterium]
MEKREFISRSPSETWDIGEQIGRKAKPGELYTLHGELGSGKTQLVKGIARGIGVLDWEYVVSPSFTIMNVYEGHCMLAHVDLYRIGAGEAEDLNMEEYLQRGIVVVEWAEKGEWWSNTNIDITVENTGESERKIVIIKP